MSESLRICYVDIETPTWFDDPAIKALPRDLQLLAMHYGIAVTWDKEVAGSQRENFDDPAFELWNDDDANLLWHYLHRFDVIAGWNIIAFDLPIISHAASESIHAAHGFPQVFDLFDIIRKITGRWYKLETMAQANLGRSKTGDGKQASKWLREGELQMAADYCRNDVELERDLGQMALEGDWLTLPGLDKPGQGDNLRLRLNWAKKLYDLQGKF
jgi:hypothetical protein